MLTMPRPVMIFALGLALVTLWVAPPAGASFPGRNGELVISSYGARGDGVLTYVKPWAGTARRIVTCSVDRPPGEPCDGSGAAGVSADGRSIALTAAEFRLLRYLMLHPGRILSKDSLFDHVYGFEGEAESNVIEVYVKRLRVKLGRHVIRTRRGQGYVLGRERT